MDNSINLVEGKMKFNYDGIEFTYFPEFILEDTSAGKFYLFLFQNEITALRKCYEVFVKNNILDKERPEDVNDPTWKIIGFKEVERKKNEFDWKEYNDDSKLGIGDYELLIDDGKTSIMYAHYDGKKFDINTKKFKILEYREAHYLEYMPTEEGVYRITIYNAYTKTRRTIPAYMINNKFIFENGLVIGDTITLVSECLTKWIDAKTMSMVDVFMTVLGNGKDDDIIIIDNQAKILLYNNEYADCNYFAIYKDNSRCKLGLLDAQ